jgi:hypothetical protein
MTTYIVIGGFTLIYIGFVAWWLTLRKSDARKNDAAVVNVSEEGKLIIQKGESRIVINYEHLTNHVIMKTKDGKLAIELVDSITDVPLSPDPSDRELLGESNEEETATDPQMLEELKKSVKEGTAKL